MHSVRDGSVLLPNTAWDVICGDFFVVVSAVVDADVVPACGATAACAGYTESARFAEYCMRQLPHLLVMEAHPGRTRI